MRTLNRNKQKMYYALYDAKVPIYQLDEDGQIQYVEIDGVLEPIETGEYRTNYKAPVEFKANITSTLASSTFQPFGIDRAATMATLCTKKGEFPLVIGTLIWRTTEIKYREDGTPDPSSADYIVKGDATEVLNEDLYLLEKMNPNSKEE